MIKYNSSILVSSKNKKLYFSKLLRCITETHSTCDVKGNMSTGCISFMLYFSSSFDKSLTIVAGLQLIYTNFSGLNFNMLFIVVSSKPLLGGSTNTTFGVICFSCNKFSKTFSTSPQVNSIFSILFIFAFSFASSIAYTFFTNFEAYIPIVPIPQYRSSKISSAFKREKVYNFVMKYICIPTLLIILLSYILSTFGIITL